MEQENELVYLGRRASEERRAAVSCSNRMVRDVHLEFASAYEFKLHLLRKQETLAEARARSVARIIIMESSERADTPDDARTAIGAEWRRPVAIGSTS